MKNNSEFAILPQIATLFQSKNRAIPELLQDMVQLVPMGWQQPEIAAARITYGDVVIISKNFRITPWMQTATFELGDKTVAIDVIYLKEKCIEHEGPSYPTASEKRGH